MRRFFPRRGEEGVEAVLVEHVWEVEEGGVGGLSVLPSHRAHGVLWLSSCLGYGVALFTLSGVGLLDWSSLSSPHPRDIGGRRGVVLNIVCVGVWDRWRGASVAWWLESRGRYISEGWFSGGFSVCRLGSQSFFSVRD